MRSEGDIPTEENRAGRQNCGSDSVAVWKVIPEEDESTLRESLSEEFFPGLLHKIKYLMSKDLRAVEKHLKRKKDGHKA